MKKFVMYWDETFIKESTQIVDISFFSTFNGFDINDVPSIDRLDIGETLPMDNNHVWIMRIK